MAGCKGSTDFGSFASACHVNGEEIVCIIPWKLPIFCFRCFKTLINPATWAADGRTSSATMDAMGMGTSSAVVYVLAGRSLLDRRTKTVLWQTTHWVTERASGRRGGGGLWPWTWARFQCCNEAQGRARNKNKSAASYLLLAFKLILTVMF